MATSVTTYSNSMLLTVLQTLSVQGLGLFLDHAFLLLPLKYLSLINYKVIGLGSAQTIRSVSQMKPKTSLGTIRLV